jgi:hypothetical protein
MSDVARDFEMMQLTALVGQQNMFRGWQPSYSDSDFQLTNLLVITLSTELL